MKCLKYIAQNKMLQRENVLLVRRLKIEDRQGFPEELMDCIVPNFTE